MECVQGLFMAHRYHPGLWSFSNSWSHVMVGCTWAYLLHYLNCISLLIYVMLLQGLHLYQSLTGWCKIRTKFCFSYFVKQLRSNLSFVFAGYSTTLQWISADQRESSNTETGCGASINTPHCKDRGDPEPFQGRHLGLSMWVSWGDPAQLSTC